MDIDVNSVLKCPSRMANEEFFDAEEGANLAREDDSDDFLKQLEAAIGAEDPPSPKHGNSKDDIAMTLENGLTKSFGELNGLDSAGIDSNQTIESKIIPLAGIDEKLENDLLKDLDEDNNEDLDTVCEEVKNLLESAIADSETLKQETVSNKDLAPENNEEKRISEGDEKNENKAEDKLPQTNGNDNQTSENSVVDPVDNSSVSLEDIAKEPSGNKEIESKNDDLLVACSSPKESTKVICENSSETSSNDTPEDSSDSEKQANMNGNNETSEDTETQLRSKESSDTEAHENGKDESVEIERQPTMGELLAPASGDDDEMQLCMIADAESDTKEPEEIVTPESSSPKPSVPLKLPFMRSFSNAVGKLSRIDLEQLLIEKITESIMFCSENTNIRARLEKQEKITEAYKKRLDNAKKQYNDLEMIHSRVMKDLRDRPDAPITPVKITRAVGLQVYQPQPRSKFTPPSTTLMPTKTLKRPIESETVVNGTGVSPESKKKKTMKTTPLRPMLSDQQRKSLELEEAKVEQNMRNNVIGSISPAATPSNASSAPLSGATRKSVNAQSIDLTDDGEEAKSTAQHGNQQVHQPPALVAIRGNQAQQPIKKKFVIHPSQSPTRNKFPQQRIDSRVRCHPAPLPNTPPQITRPGMKKIPPRPNIKINNANLGIVVSWTIECLTIEHTEIHSYQIYAYEVTINPPAVDNWRHVGDVKALLLPMAVTLTQFQEGQKYFFAVRAVDVHKRLGPFSLPKSWAEK